MVASNEGASAAHPRVLLPVGITTSTRPRIEWKWHGQADAWQVRIRARSSGTDFEGVRWESQAVTSDVCFLEPDTDLPSHVSLCAEVRAKRRSSWLPWGIASIFRIEPICPLHEGIVVYDLHYTRQMNPMQAFAHAHLVSALQGLVNRNKPRLYVRFIRGNPTFATPDLLPDGDIDQFWLERLKIEDGWLGESVIRNIDRLPELLELFGDAFSGLVLWDTAVPATSNVASTVAAADSLLPVPCCSSETVSLYRELVTGMQLPVKIDLRGKFTGGGGTIPETGRQSTGSAKCDAYLWAVENYLATGKSDACFMGNYLDGWWIHDPSPGGDWQNHLLTNHDYFISRRAFFWDLDVWDDEAPVDDPAQRSGTDAETLCEIMATASRVLQNREMIHVGGFTPSAFKYTNYSGAGGQHDPVATSRELVRVLSSYNAYLDADAPGSGAMANASFLCHYPLPKSFAPVLAFTPDEMRDAGLLTSEDKPGPMDFILNHTGNYDSAAVVWNTLSFLWESPARGKVPISWAINPNLAERATPLCDIVNRTRTAKDHFMTGNSGAGFINPTQLHTPREPSQLPDGRDVWIRHCLKWYRLFGLRFTGLVENGSAGPMTAAAESMYLALSPDGIVIHKEKPGDYLHDVAKYMPVFEFQTDLDDLQTATSIIRDKTGEHGDRPRFLVFRQAFKSPDYYQALLQKLKEEPGIEPVFCDPHTFAGLAKAHLGCSNNEQCTILFDTLPDKARAGEEMCAELALRNDGWNPWTPGVHSLQVQVIRSGDGEAIWNNSVTLRKPVGPGEAIILTASVPTPSFPGDYLLQCDMASHGKPFSTSGGYGSEQRFTVIRADIAATV